MSISTVEDRKNWIREWTQAYAEVDVVHLVTLGMSPHAASRSELSLILMLYVSRISQSLYENASDPSEVDRTLVNNYLARVRWNYPTLSDEEVNDFVLRAFKDVENWMSILAEGTDSPDEWWRRQTLVFNLALNASGTTLLDVDLLNGVIDYVYHQF